MKATKGGDFKPSPQPMPTTTFARCYSVIDFGTSEQFFNGESNGMQRRIYVTMELPELTYVFNEEKGPQPYVIGKEMKLSSHENSGLALFVSGMRGFPFTPEEQEGFDPGKLLTKSCFLSFSVKPKAKYATQQITQFTNENSKLVISAMVPLPAAVQQIPQVNPTIYFDFDAQMVAGQFDLDTFARIPKWMREKIEKSDEFAHFVALGQVAVGQQFGGQSAPPQQAYEQNPPNQAPVQQAPVQQPPVQQAPVYQEPQANPPVNPPAGAGAPTGW